jgi:ABC-type glycerol-3-phosphate transport system substrate-binding protein
MRLQVHTDRFRHRARFGVLVLALAVAGCAGVAQTTSPSAPGASTESGSPPASTSAPEPVVLTIWTPENRPDDAAAHKWLIEQFRTEHPNTDVQITITSWDDHFTKVDAAIAAGDVPDIVYTWQPNTAALMKKGALADISDIWTALGPDNFPAGEREVLSKDNKWYALPFIGYPHVFYYRKDWLAAVGREAPKTWDDIIAAAEAITTGDRYGICLFSKGLDAYYVTDLMLAAGAQTFDEAGKVAINSPATLKVLEFIKTINDRGLAQPGWTAMNMDDAKLPFMAGKCGMKIDSSSFIGTLNKDAPDLLANVGAVPIPLNGGQYAGWAGTSAYAVMAASKHQAEAKEFLEFLFRPEIYAGFMARGVLGFQPVFKPVAESADFYNQERIKPVADLYRGASAAAASGYPSPTFGGPEVSDKLSIVYNQQVYSEMAARIEQGQRPQDVLVWAEQRIAELTKGS